MKLSSTKYVPQSYDKAYALIVLNKPSSGDLLNGIKYLPLIDSDDLDNISTIFALPKK